MLKEISKINGVQKLNSKEQKAIKGGGKRDEGLFEDCGTQHEGATCNSDSDCPDPATCNNDGNGSGICSCDGFGLGN